MKRINIWTIRDPVLWISATKTTNTRTMMTTNHTKIACSEMQKATGTKMTYSESRTTNKQKVVKMMTMIYGQMTRVQTEERPAEYPFWQDVDSESV